VTQKPMFVLVKGNLQGAGKKITSKNFPPICKFGFLESFAKIYEKIDPNKDSKNLKYSQAKNLDNEYNQSASQFYQVFSDWIRTDGSKYYEFKL